MTLDYTWERREELIRRDEREKGRHYEIFNSVHENDYSIERGAEKLNVTVTEFDKQFLEWKKENQKE